MGMKIHVHRVCLRHPKLFVIPAFSLYTKRRFLRQRRLSVAPPAHGPEHDDRSLSSQAQGILVSSPSTPPGLRLVISGRDANRPELD